MQLPLSAHMDLKELCKRILPNKDVDGFTPDSLGRLCLNEPSFVPCTALAVHHIVTSLGQSVLRSVIFAWLPKLFIPYEDLFFHFHI